MNLFDFPRINLTGTPRTRDMSASRRTLLQAWCRKVSG